MEQKRAKEGKKSLQPQALNSRSPKPVLVTVNLKHNKSNNKFIHECDSFLS